jgi:hypothetical protein
MPISESMARAILGHRTDEVAVILLTISGDGFTTFRVCSDSANVTSGGNTFTAYPFEVELPGDGDGAPVARLRIGNVSRQIWEAIEDATGQILVKIELVLASSPNTIEKSFDGLELRNVTCNALTVEGELTTQQFTSEPYPHIRAIPSRLPGLFFD